MADWIDLALMLSEKELSDGIDQLGEAGRKNVLSQLLSLFQLRAEALEGAMLRVLIERARPLALSAGLWTRPISSSTDILEEARMHLLHLGVNPTSDRLQRAQSLYAQFIVERDRIPVTIAQLTKQGYRCGHCGLAFCDEELRDRGIVSPFGSRGSPKVDLLKPHWSTDENRRPTLDHDWPVTLYGDNSTRNQRVLCHMCNLGKENYLALEQMRPFNGLPRRTQLTGSRPLPPDLFYAQIRLHPICARTGKTAADAELTVVFRDLRCVGVLGNLVTVESPGP